MPSSRSALSAHNAKIPDASQPYVTNGQWNGAAKNSSVIHRLWPHSFMATCIISAMLAALRKKNDQEKPIDAAYTLASRLRRYSQVQMLMLQPNGNAQ